jgi:hypothetical protein
MKNILCIAVLMGICLMPVVSVAQSKPGKASIGMLGRYTSNGVELRWIPDNKTILRLGFQQGYSLERRQAGSGAWNKMAAIKPYAQAQWQTLIANETNPDTRSNLELAMDFLFAGDQADPAKLNLDQGIAALNERKSKEDMVYAVFVLTALREAKVAEALGLAYTDKTVQQGIEYEYRVSLIAQSPVYAVENGSVKINTVLQKNPYQYEVFVYPGDQKLSFAWPETADLAGFFVERAAAGETVFKPLNETPIFAAAGEGFEGNVNNTFVDDSLQNYTWYRYRFYGTTAFGEKVLFAEVKGMPRDLTPPPPPVIKQPKHLTPKQVLIEWEMYGDTPDLRGFLVGRSNSDTGNFTVLHKTLLSSKTRSFVDEGFNKDGLNFYLVYALDTAGNLSASYPGYVALIDSIPPAKPLIQSAVIDSNGIVTITIKKGIEKDLKGYKLFTSNSPEHEFSAIREAFRADREDSNDVQLIFRDTVTLQSLTPKIYYRVKALDFNYNQSVFSEIAAVVRPDTIPPVAPVFNDVLVMEKAVQLLFSGSSSVDVKEHYLYRKTATEAPWQLLKNMDKTASQYLDTSVVQGVTYFYSLRAKDLGGLYSTYAMPVQGRPFDTGVRPPVENLTGVLEDKKLTLTWTYPAIGKDVYFIVYKQNRDGQLVKQAIVKENTFSMSTEEKKAIYAVKAGTYDGGESGMSAPLQVKEK